MSIERVVGFAVFAHAVAACSDTTLKKILDADSSNLRVATRAEVCAPAPIEEEVPYKILFVIDTSLSNRWNDATEKRVDAYLGAVDEHLAQKNVSFGVITFNDYAHKPTLVYTRDRDILTSLSEILSNDKVGGGTNYEDAISTMFDYVVNDISSSASALEPLRTHYLVYWLSDGFPTFGTTNRRTLVANVEAVREYLASRVATFRLDTLYLESTGEWESEAEIREARLLLEEMATAGGGRFTNITSGEAFEFDIDPAPQLRRFSLEGFVASNRNAHFGSTHPTPDSDGDGISDDDEMSSDLDPTNPDTDGDGLRDGIELMTAGLHAPKRTSDACVERRVDSDGDGLSDCEEEAVGTSAHDPDTDRDGIPDDIEIFLGGAALSRDPTEDEDLDGQPDMDEVMTHLEPHVPNSAEEIARWAYRYEMEPLDGKGDEPPCFELRVDNVGIYETLETKTHPRGWQAIDLVVAFGTTDGSNIQRFLRAEQRALLILPDLADPPGGGFRLDPEDFSEMAQ